MELGLSLTSGGGGASASARAEGGGITDPYAAYRVYASFTAANGTTIENVSESGYYTSEKGGRWDSRNGTWQVQGNSARCTTTGPGDFNIITINAGAANVTISTTSVVGVGATSMIRVIGNYVDANNYWVGIVLNTSILLYENSSGSFTLRDSKTIVAPANSEAVTASMTTNGNTISFTAKSQTATYTDGTSRTSKTSTHHGLNTYQGYGAAEGQIDYQICTII